ncbi:MAG: enoyl-CoA hydratase/isomerase family protein, partial [Rickettsiales bacterium]
MIVSLEKNALSATLQESLLGSQIDGIRDDPNRGRRARTPSGVELDEDGDLRVLILRGEGKSFCSGADLKDRPFDEGAKATLARSKNGMKMADAIANLSAVTIACLHNYCIGGGAVLPAFCDFRIAARSTSLTINEISIGVNLSWNAIPPVVQLVGPARAKEMIILGRTYDGTQLHEMGYVTDVVDDDDLLPA